MGDASILVLGARGQLGTELSRALGGHRRIERDKDDFDLLDRAALEREIDTFSGSIIVNAAAFTDVDGAEKNVEVARTINATVPAILGARAAARGIAVVHVSTDFVFDGETDRPYRESDATHPLSVYGQTKLEGEEALLASGAGALILRTAWLWSTTHKSFVSTMLRLAHEREELSVVDDQFGSPTWARDLADAIAALVGLWFERGEPWLSQVRGVYHVAGQGCASRLELANAVFELDPRRAEQKLRSVKGVATSAFPLPARRPRFAPLDGSRTKERLGIELPPWRDSLARALSER